MADAARAWSAPYDVTNVRCKQLFAELDTGQPGAAAEAASQALLAIVAAWRDAPSLPAELRKLASGADLRLT
ncbi:hypothetical protein [Streptomyces sp. NPDC023838]|uniref:hypothetical protein n=1 Tax=Streptomyces sp. NPDC023838 TaxID=3154325 RepID=UPI0033D5260C